MNEPGFTHTFGEFGKAMSFRMEALGMSMQQVVHEQAGLWARTLINYSPPRSIPNARQKMVSEVSGKFAQAASDNPREMEAEGGKAGRGDIRWYAFQDDAIFGVAKDLDMRDASVDDLYKLNLNLKLNKQGRRVLGQRGKQTVYVWQKVLTKRATVQALIARMRKHFGRLKASWVPSWQALGAPGSSLPAAVQENASGARGYPISELGNAEKPAFTMVSTAVGANEKTMGAILRVTAQVRAKAIVADTILHIRGIKK